MSSPRTIYLVRHGESQANVDPLLYRQGDHAVGLTDRGFVQAAGAAEKLRASMAARFGDDALPIVWASPYKRCRQTAVAIATPLGVPQRESVLIREQEFGLFDGLTPGQVETFREVCEVMLDRLTDGRAAGSPEAGFDELTAQREAQAVRRRRRNGS